MLFFQLLLLFGYLYAHWLQSSLRHRRQANFHSILLIASLLLPIAANPAWKPAAGDNSSLRILLLLTATIGLPYFALSATSSLIQAGMPVLITAQSLIACLRSQTQHPSPPCSPILCSWSRLGPAPCKPVSGLRDTWSSYFAASEQHVFPPASNRAARC